MNINLRLLDVVRHSVAQPLAQDIGSDVTYLTLGKEKLYTSSSLGISNRVVLALLIIAQRIETVRW